MAVIDFRHEISSIALDYKAIPLVYISGFNVTAAEVRGLTFINVSNKVETETLKMEIMSQSHTTANLPSFAR